MKKVILVLFAVILLSAIAVGGYWYMGVGKFRDSIETTLISAQQELNKNNVTLSYGSLDTAGFPMNLSVNINDLKISANNAPNGLDVIFKGPIQAQTPLTGGEVSFALPTAIDIEIKTPSDTEAYSVQYNTPPLLAVTFEGMDIFDLLSGNAPQSPEAVMKKFKKFSYSDNGSRILNKSTGEELYSQKQALLLTDAVIDDTRANLRLIAKSVESQTNPNNPEMGEIGKLVFSSSADLGKTTVSMDITFDLPSQQMNIMTSQGFIDIQDITLQNDYFGLSIKGRVDKDGTDIAPYGLLNISMNNYNSLVDHFVTSLNKQKNSVSNTSQPLTPEQLLLSQLDFDETQMKATIKQMLQAMSDDPTSSSNDISITIKREKGSAPTNVTVGTLNIEQLMGLSAALASPAGSQPQSPPPNINSMQAPAREQGGYQGYGYTDNTAPELPSYNDEVNSAPLEMEAPGFDNMDSPFMEMPETPDMPSAPALPAPPPPPLP